MLLGGSEVFMLLVRIIVRHVVEGLHLKSASVSREEQGKEGAGAGRIRKLFWKAGAPATWLPARNPERQPDGRIHFSGRAKSCGALACWP